MPSIYSQTINTATVSTQMQILFPGTRAARIKLTDLELLNRITDTVEKGHGNKPVYCAGRLWFYYEGLWQPFEDELLSALIGKINPGIRASQFQGLMKAYKASRTARAHFDVVEVGVPCRNGFVVFGEDGTATLRDHDCAHRNRWLVPGEFDEDSKRLPQNSLLARFFAESFRDDPYAEEKIDALGQVAGVIAAGQGTKLTNPRAIFLLGQANSGKSEIIKLLRGLLPPHVQTSLKLSQLCGDWDRYIPGFIGSLLNACDETTTENMLSSDMFKKLVDGGTPVVGRGVGEKEVSGEPMAQLVFASNTFPVFKDMDDGVRRRLALITFDRVVLKEARINGIAEKILNEEMDVLLNFAIRGFSTIVREGWHFKLPSNHEDILEEHIANASPLHGFIEENIVEDEAGRLAMAEAWARWQRWGGEHEPELYRRLGERNFWKEMRQVLGASISSGKERRIRGYRLRKGGEQ